MSLLVCRLFGHRRFEVRVLDESFGTVHYRGGFRDDDGRALSWPECPRCGWQIVPVMP